MERGHWLILAGSVGLALVLGWYFKDQIVYGFTKITYDSEEDPDIMKTKPVNGIATVGGVPADPGSLASSAGLDLNTYALARMIESEAAILKNDNARLGVGEAALNYAYRLGKSIGSILLNAKGSANGYFGEQGQGRYASTSRDPSRDSINAAQLAMAGSNITGGADQWDSPWSYTSPGRAAEVAVIRIAAGKEMFVLPDVPERKLRFWRYA